MTTDTLDPELAARLQRTPDGLLPVVVQDVETSAVLMLAWVDDEALRRTLATGRGTYWSRSRQEYWVKGETSGNVQWVHRVSLDCDADTMLFLVRQVGPACHTGTTTCFTGREIPVAVSDPERTESGLSTSLEERTGLDEGTGLEDRRQTS